MYSDIIILGGVPIVVFIPPNMHANASGIKNLEGCQFIFWQIFNVIGSNIANAPMLLINDDKTAAISIKLKIN